MRVSCTGPNGHEPEIPDQSTGVARATITTPEAPLGWDKTSIETRVDPAQEQPH